MAPFLFSQRRRRIYRKVKYISSIPLTIELFLDKLNYFFLFSLYSSLLFSKPIKFRLSLRNLFAVSICILNPTVRILIPNIKDGNCNISSQIMKSLFAINGDFSFIVGILNIIKLIKSKWKLLPSFTLLICYLLFKSLKISIIIKYLFIKLINLVAFVCKTVFYQVFFLDISCLLKIIYITI